MTTSRIRMASTMALIGALAASASPVAGPEMAQSTGKMKFRERKPQNKQAGSKLARKAARGKL